LLVSENRPISFARGLCISVVPNPFTPVNLSPNLIIAPASVNRQSGPVRGLVGLDDKRPIARR